MASHDIDLESIDPGRIDIPKLASVHPSAHKIWVRKHRAEAEAQAFARMKEEYENLSISEIPNHIHDYFRIFDKTQKRPTRTMIVKSRIILKPSLFRCVTFLTSNGSHSCNELLFGENWPVALFGRTAAFVRRMMAASPNTREDILHALEIGRLNTDNLFLTFKHRCYDAAFSKDRSLASLEDFTWATDEQRRVLQELLYQDLPLQITELKGAELETATGNYGLILRFCMELNLPADYFLIQDYSDRATLNGQPLSDEERRYLSLYLCATPSAQLTAICKLSAAPIDSHKA